MRREGYLKLRLVPLLYANSVLLGIGVSARMFLFNQPSNRDELAEYTGMQGSYVWLFMCRYATTIKKSAITQSSDCVYADYFVIIIINILYIYMHL